MAEAVLADAQLLLRQGGSAWSIINRAYYAMFYATAAFLLSIGQGSAKHSRVIALFDRHFVKSGRFPMEMSQWLHKAFELPQRSDYQDMDPLEQDQARTLVQWPE
ncbi:MAG: HEPN domain-containing protein [Thermoguttaceae bacterium]|nr:HEPN domain-containing protein [Thermoguttaceae bacterium]MDW8037910.1 HEPN domain-containing protein [Thermoguttaceae bacterium]